LLPDLAVTYRGVDWRSFLAMPAPLLDAHITRMPVVRAQFMLDVAEAVAFGAGVASGGHDAYTAWRNRLEQFVHGDAIFRADGSVESFQAIRARREAGRAERERQRREAAEA
jgi:hypothetical protein